MNKVLDSFSTPRMNGLRMTLILIISLFLLAACGNAERDQAIDTNLDLPIAIEPIAPAEVDVVNVAEAAIADGSIGEYVAEPEMLAEAVEEAPAVVEAPIEVVEEVVVAPEPVVEQTPFIEVAGIMVNPDSIDPNAKAVGYYKSFDGGRDMTLALRPNGNVEWRIDMHNDEEPIVYIGTWVTGVDTFTIRVSGLESGAAAVAEDYVFTRAGDFVYTGQFMGSDLTFYHFKALAAGAIMPAYDQATAETRYANKAFIGTYKAMLIASDAPGRDATIVLNEDGTMEWTSYALNRDEPTIELGTWQADSNGQLSLLVLDRDGRVQNPARAFNFTLKNGVLHSDKFHASLFSLSDLFIDSAIQTGNN